jgi:hypothetical protein
MQETHLEVIPFFRLPKDPEEERQGIRPAEQGFAVIDASFNFVPDAW